MLNRIIEQKKIEVAQLSEQYAGIHQSFEPNEKVYRASLAARIRNRKRRVGVIAEVKKASPSKGIIRPDFEPLTIAKAYQTADVEGISVLTDRDFFQGDLLYLPLVKNVSEKPILRKDFIIDELQIMESYLIGADCILLIVAALEPYRLLELRQLARDCGLEVLMEVHTEQELEIALPLAPEILGINNRDLNTFTTSLHTTEKLMQQIPKGTLVISESGISTPDDIAFLADLGVDAVLVGEHFMRQTDITKAVRELVG